MVFWYDYYVLGVDVLSCFLSGSLGCIIWFNGWVSVNDD